MDPAVDDELLECESGHLTSHRVEAAEENGVRGLVDDQVHAGDLFEGTDVAPLAADDPPLHVVAREVHARHHRLAGLLGGQPLDHRAQDRLGARLGLVVRLSLDVPGGDRGSAFRVGLDALDQLKFRVVRSEAGDPLEGQPPVLLDVEQPSAPGVNVALRRHQRMCTRLEVAALRVQTLLALTEPVLATLDVLSLFLQILVQVVATLGRVAASERNDADADHGDGYHRGEDDLQQLHDTKAGDHEVRVCCLTPKRSISRPQSL